MEPPTAGPTGDTPPTPPPPPPFQPIRRLHRYPSEGPLGGVCAGVARYFGVDPTLVRIGAVALALAGPGVVVYGLAWLLLPTATSAAVLPWSRAPRRLDRATQIGGIVLLVVAVSVLWGDWWFPGDGFFLPLGLIALGAWLLLRRDEDADGSAPPPGPPWTPGAGGDPTAASSSTATPWAPASGGPPGPTATPWTGSSGGSEVGAPDDAGGTAGTSIDAGDLDDAPWGVASPPEGSAIDPTQVAGGGGGPSPPWGPQPPEGPHGPGAAPIDPATARRRRLLGPLVMGALLIWGGLAWLAGVDPEDALAVGLCLIGVGFVLGAFVGGTRGLLLPAFAVGGALLVTAVIDVPLSGGIGERTWTPRSAADIDEPYELGIGEGVLDLLAIVPDDGEVVEVEASVGIGHLVVYVPRGTEVEISSDVTAGEAVLLGNTVNGVDVEHERTVDGSSGSGTIELDLRIGVGQVEVIERPATVASQGDSDAPSTTSTTVLG